MLLSQVSVVYLLINGIMDLGSLSSYLVFVRQTAMPINQFTQQLNFILAPCSAERIFDLMNESEEVDEGKVTLTQVEILEDGSMQESNHYTGHWAWRHPRDNALNLFELKGDVRFP